jgi:DNA-binding NarL/FixJ family response regulator
MRLMEVRQLWTAHPGSGKELYEPMSTLRRAATVAQILVVDDHPLVRQGLLGLIANERDIAVCGEASGVTEARRLAEALRPDIAIIDLTLKDGSGLALIKEFREHFANMKLIVLSMHDELLFAERALRAGAVGYVSKDEVSRTIVQALREVMAGKIYLSQRMTQRMMHRAVGARGDSSRSPIERLTDRESEVFEMIGQGLGTRQIAHRLGLSPKTIETHREHIKDKLELKSTTELTKHAVQWVLESH